MQVSKWGNSLAIRLPAAVVQVLGLKHGDQVEVRASSKTDLVIQRQQGNRAILEGLRKYRGTLPADFKFDRQAIYGDKR